MDAGNNRVMVWSGFPDSNGQPADAILGQAGMGDCDLNRGACYPSSLAVNMPYALGVLGERLIVGDTGNSRLLGFAGVGFAAAADRLTGQPDFACKGDNRWGMAERDSLCWPYGLSVRGSTVAVADSGNNRVLIWEAAP